MATVNNETYFVVRDEQGDEYLCPLNTVRKKVSENNLCNPEKLK